MALLAARIALAGTNDEAKIKSNADNLQTWVTSHPHDAEAWSVLGQLWGRTGQRLRSLRAEAEARHALGDFVGAIERLRVGQRLARSGSGPGIDFIEASVIDARLRDIELERRQLSPEERKQGG